MKGTLYIFIYVVYLVLTTLYILKKEYSCIIYTLKLQQKETVNLKKNHKQNMLKMNRDRASPPGTCVGIYTNEKDGTFKSESI